MESCKIHYNLMDLYWVSFNHTTVGIVDLINFNASLMSACIFLIWSHCVAGVQMKESALQTILLSKQQNYQNENIFTFKIKK